jgi:hypothetical protein
MVSAWFPAGLVIVERRKRLYYQRGVSVSLTVQSYLSVPSTSDRRVRDKDRSGAGARLVERGSALPSYLFDLAKWIKQRLQVRILSKQKSRKIVNNYARTAGVST